MKNVFLAFLAIMVCCAHVQGQNIEGQIIASQFGQFQVPGNANGSLQFDPSSCEVSSEGKNFAAFAAGVPIKIVDSNPALDEIDVPFAVFISACAVSMHSTYLHSTPFYLTSGTGGLQEAINSGPTRGVGPNTIILNSDWYSQVAPGNPATVIASVKGNTSLGLVDVTTSPYTSYSWNGSAYVVNASSGGNAISLQGSAIAATTPTASQVLQFAGGAWTPETISGTGTVTAFSFPGALGALFSCTVANSTTTPSVTCAEPNAAANSVYGNFSGTAGTPGFSNAPAFSAANLTGFPTLNQNTSGTSGGLSVASALPNGTTATTQATADNSTKLATDAFVLANQATAGVASFNARSGAVAPASGDYTVSQVTGAATSGANSNITSLTGLTTPLSAAQGGTGNTTGSASSLSAASAIPNGSTGTTQSAGDNTTKIATDAFVLANQVTAGVASFNARSGAVAPASGDYTVSQVTGAATSGANSNITSLTGLTTPLSVAQGGTGNTADSASSLSAASAIPNGSTGTTQSAGDNTTKLATDAFVLANGGGASTPATSSVLKGNGSANGVVAATPGTDYLSPSVTASQGVQNFNNRFYVDSFPSSCTLTGTGGAGSYTDQSSCAWYTAEIYKHANHVTPIVIWGQGIYTVNSPLVDYVDGNSYDDEYAVAAEGCGDKCTYLQYAGATGHAFFSRATGGGNFATMTLRGMTIDGGALANADIDVDSIGQSYWENFSAGHVAPGADHVIRLGATGGGDFQNFVSNVNVGVYPDQGTMNCGTFTANVVSGSITSYTVNSGGTCYSTYSGSTELTVVSIRGYRGGAYPTPCATMPVGMVATISGSAVTAISEGTNSGGSGCSGTIDVQVYQTPNVNYGVVFNNSDSTAKDVVSYVGSIAAFSTIGPATYIHLHPSVVPNGITTTGGEHFSGTEIDDIGGYGFIVNYPFTQEAETIEGTEAFIGGGRLLPGSATFYFAGAATANMPVNIGAMGSLCSANPGGGAPADWQEFVTQSGTINSQADYLNKTPAGLSVLGNDTSCGQAMGDWDPLLVRTGVTSFDARTGAVTPASGDYTVSQVTGAAPLASPALTGSPTAPTQTAGDNTTKIATDAFVLANAGSNGVSSFNGRTGAVTPTSGDYTASQVTGAATSGANSNITSLTGLTTPLSTAQGGTGAGVLTGPRYANGASADTVETSAQAQSTIGNGIYVPAGGYYGGTATGAVNVLAITLPSGLGSPTLTQLTGVLLSFIPNLANTSTAPTLNVNGLGAVTIVSGVSTALASGDIATGTIAFVVYNGTNFQLQNPQVQIPELESPSGWSTANQVQALVSTNNLTFNGGRNASSSSTLGSGIFRGGNNSGTGAAGNGMLEAGANTSTGAQGFANVQQSFTVASALSQTFEVVTMTTTADQVQAAALGAANILGIAETVGGTNTQLYVADSGKTTVRFDGTPVVGDFACAPPPSTGTVGYAHDNGTTACPAGQKVGVVTGQVSGTGSGATATVLLHIGS